MANSKGSSTMRNMMYNGKNSLLPPKCPFPSLPPSYDEYIPTSVIGPKAPQKPRHGNSHHQRTSSESFLLEEQPSWLDELLNEPEPPVRRGGHRRSSSDSFAYIDTANVGSMNYVAQDDNKLINMTPLSSWGSQDFDFYKGIQHSSFYANLNPSGKTKNKPWNTPISSVAPPRGRPSPRDTAIVPNAGSLSTSQDADRDPTSLSEKQEDVESGPKGSSGKDSTHVKSSASETDTKRAKQQFAQRSRVRKLQYIAELERNVQALQAEGSEVSAELEFLNQQNLILTMENKALKQRLDSLSQEQLIKYMEHEVLEREVARLRSLYHQQQQPQQQQQPMSSSHRRAKSRDLDQQFTNLSLKHKEATAGHDPVSSQLHT
ncbi:uncharacterized protein At4g06598 [Sesamum indicum]|uniref:Uncharacterized protein At4g06598 n=1 Tax=Sesamum indicum TaxID=4182 RepID=A0A6I9TY84_SESIN|nr:uncharacterized protein At4g06598 [Sesamum indicum]XP_011092333.1 uncharacterized protein At4g06598 [Sesamum indicum]